MNYYNFKEEHPEIHQQLTSAEIRYIGEDNVITVPPYRSQCGRRLMIYRFGNWNPRKYPAEMLFKATVGILEISMLEPRQQIMGGIAIFDLKDISMTHAWSVTPQVYLMPHYYISSFFLGKKSFEKYLIIYSKTKTIIKVRC